MARNLGETFMGAVVVVAAVGFAYYAYTRSNIVSVEGYEVIARFDRVDGLSEGSDVSLAGIKVGSIVEQTIDPRTYQAVVRMSIDPSYRLPVDTSAAVVSDGLLGGKYLSVEPGGADEMIEPRGEIKYTQSSILLEQLLGKFAFGGAGE